jgi:hypothetical protein
MAKIWLNLPADDRQICCIFFFIDDRHFGFVIEFLKRTLPLTSGPIEILGRSLQKRRYEDQWQEGTYYGPQ